MVTAQTTGRLGLDEERCQKELTALRMKIAQHAAKFAMIAQLLRDDPGAIVFDEQLTRRSSDTVAHFTSKEFDIVELKQLVAQIRDLEEGHGLRSS